MFFKIIICFLLMVILLIKLLKKIETIYNSFMEYKKLTQFNDIEFKYLVGVSPHLFSKMIPILEEAERLKK